MGKGKIVKKRLVQRRWPEEMVMLQAWPSHVTTSDKNLFQKSIFSILEYQELLTLPDLYFIAYLRLLLEQTPFIELCFQDFHYLFPGAVS